MGPVVCVYDCISGKSHMIGDYGGVKGKEMAPDVMVGGWWYVEVTTNRIYDIDKNLL